MPDLELRRKRRRWLIAPLILVAAMLAWWHWPRGDSRLVGTWSLQVRTDSMTTPVATLALWPSGAGTSTSPTGAARFRWHVDGGRFVVGGGWPTLPGRALDWFQRTTLSLFGTTFLIEEEIYEVTDITEAEIRMRGEGPASNVELILTRLPQ